MQEAGDDGGSSAATRGARLAARREQLLDEPGDWRVQRPQLAGRRLGVPVRERATTPISTTPPWSPGPCIRRATPPTTRRRIDRALDWLVGMQSSNGGFAAFDADNTHYYLNHIPFADHGALLDPPTSDVTARVVTALGASSAARRTSRRWSAPSRILRDEQEPDGSWFGRWGTNYIYGTWSVLTALAQARCRRRRSGGAARGRLAACAAECRRRLGREQRQLRSRQRARAAQLGEHPVPDGLGAAGAAGGGRGAARMPCAAASNICCARSSARRAVERSELHRAGLPARVLSEVSRLLRLFSALGAGGLPQR